MLKCGMFQPNRYTNRPGVNKQLIKIRNIRVVIKSLIRLYGIVLSDREIIVTFKFYQNIC